MNTVILFETNEIPTRLIDDYVSRKPKSALAKLVERSRTYVTTCDDDLELDPWISWPTLHRGVNDTAHGIHHLGQSLDWADKNYPPIWRLLHQAGVDVGVFGSLHSSHVPADAEDYSFYVPDYFAAKAYAHPAEMLPFQEFNLVMTRRSARNIDTGLPLKEVAKFGKSAVSNGLSISTMTQIAAQLADEKLASYKKIRRRNLQPVIGLDFFLSLLETKKPKFATFYTNHVAAAMHRYWAAHFTKDYGATNPMSAEWIEKYKDEIPKAMDVLDGMIAKLVRHTEKHPGTVLLMASSLGQAAVNDAGHTRGFTTVTDVGKLMDFLGVERSDWTAGHAMVPCVSVDLNPEIAESVAARLETIEVMGDKPQRSDREIAPMSFQLKNGRSLHIYFYWESRDPTGEVKLGNRVAPIADAGFGFFEHEDNVACSAHHIPEGFLAVFDPTSKAPTAPRSRVSTLSIAPALLRAFKAPVPGYMQRDTGFTIGDQSTSEKAKDLVA